eukprot:CCRYP_015313-RA/>CCRYP_015313-RA protein AED:0.39 eAED:0.35 QI:0/0/0/1/0/0.2/5/0/357
MDMSLYVWTPTGRHHCTTTPRTTPPGQRLPPKQTQPVKYVGKVHAEHLINTLTGHYDISTDWDGRRYIGLTLQWDYRNRTVRLSMPGYCEKPDNVSITLCLPNHNTNLIPALHAPTAANNNYVPLLTLHQHWESNKDLRTRSQTYNNHPRPGLPILDYALSHPNAGVTYQASDMILAAHSDASYLSNQSARSSAGNFFLSENDHYPNNNGAVLTISQIIKVVMSSAAEAELRHSLATPPSRNGPPTTTHTHSNRQLYRPWRCNQHHPTQAHQSHGHAFPLVALSYQPETFRPYWRAGATNLADYVTKHHPAIHHQAVRPLFLTTDQPTLPNSKLTAPCIPRHTLLHRPISRPAASAA